MIVVLIPTPHGRCVLRRATPGDRVTTLCCLALPCAPIALETLDLGDWDGTEPDDLCPACRIELCAKTVGAAEACDPVVERSRTETVDYRRSKTA